MMVSFIRTSIEIRIVIKALRLVLNRPKLLMPTPALLPGKSHGWRSLVGCSPWGHEEPDTTERLHFHFSLSCIAEGNGNPLHCSCLENPRDGGAWWAAVYGVAQSRTQLKRLSSSIFSKIKFWHLWQDDIYPLAQFSFVSLLLHQSTVVKDNGSKVWQIRHHLPIH